MKKIYTSVLMLSMSALVAIGQNVSPVQNRQAVYKTNDYSKPVASNGVSHSARAVALWTNTFDTPADWIIANEAGNSDDWVIGTTGPAGSFPISPITSTSGGNFALFDSDLLCSGDQLANLTVASAIDLSGSNGAVLEFEQFYRKFADKTNVLVSVDGINWTTFEVNAGLSNNDASVSNPELVQVNISGVAGGQSTVWIRFQFYSPSSYVPPAGDPGCGYAWMIDDVAIYDAAENDLVLKGVFHGDVLGGWEYEITPLAQAQSKYLGVIVTNNGGTKASNVACEYDILLDGNSVFNGSFPVADTLELAVTDTGWYDTGFTPSEVGLYTITYTIVADSVDGVPTNNTLERAFEISEYEWSHEREALWDDEYGAYVVSAEDQTLVGYSQGSLFTPVVGADLSAIKVSFGSSTSATSSAPMALTVEVHTTGQSIQDILSSEIQGVELYGTGWQTFVLEDPIALAAGTTYILAVTTSGGDDVMVLDGWGVDSDFGAANYGPFGANDAVNWYNGWNYSSAIRAVFDPTLGIEENEDVSGVNIYPNPTTDNLNINFVSKEDQNVTVNVIGVDGALVHSQNLVTKVGQITRTTVDFADLAKGIYMVQLLGSNSSLTQRVVVQ